MPEFEIDFEEAFRSQRELAGKAVEKLHELEELLKQLLPGQEPETGELRDDIQQGLTHLSEIDSLIREQWFRNRPSR